MHDHDFIIGNQEWLPKIHIIHIQLYIIYIKQRHNIKLWSNLDNYKLLIIFIKITTKLQLVSYYLENKEKCGNKYDTDCPYIQDIDEVADFCNKSNDIIWGKPSSFDKYHPTTSGMT